MQNIIQNLKKSNKNIVIIGMPGVGKSTVGKILAQTIDYTFLDSDDVIESMENQTLAQIISCKGLDGFLKAEERHVSGIKCRSHVISTGGSVVYSKKIMKHFNKNSFIVYLYSDLDILVQRLGDLKERGVAIGPGKSLEDLYLERTPLYDAYSDLKINCGSATPEQVVDLILSA